MRITRRLLSLGCFFIVVLSICGPGPLSTGACACDPPSWWGHSAKEDSYNWYFEGSGTSPVSADEALAEARRNALQQAVARLGAGFSDEVQAHLLGRVQGWEERDKWACKQWNTHQGWSRVRYPKDQLETLGAYAQGGEIQFKQATGLVEQQRYAEALALVGQLSARYPVGQQPIFRTERALLLASDCHVELGQPRQAIQGCESILAGSQDPVFQQEAQNRLATIRADYTNLLYRGVFGGKTFLVQCVTELNGIMARWPTMQKEIENMVRQAGGRVLDAASPDLSLLLERVDNPTRHVEILDGISADGFIVVSARGDMKQSTMTKDAKILGRFDFSGSVSAVLYAGGQVVHLWKTPGDIWYTGSAENCMDILMIRVFPLWQNDLAEKLDKP
jgi:hypothetical protein